MQIGKDMVYTHQRAVVLCPGKRTETTYFDLAGQNVTSESSTVHLGIKRGVSGKVNTEEKVSLGRKTAYSIFGQHLSSLALCMDLRYCYHTKKSLKALKSFKDRDSGKYKGYQIKLQQYLH